MHEGSYLCCALGCYIHQHWRQVAAQDAPNEASKLYLSQLREQHSMHDMQEGASLRLHVPIDLHS